MSTTTSSQRHTTSRLSTSQTITTINNNGNYLKFSRNPCKKPSSENNISQNCNFTNGSNNCTKRHTMITSKGHESKTCKQLSIGDNFSPQDQPKHDSNNSNKSAKKRKIHSSQSIFFHAIAPVRTSKQACDLNDKTVNQLVSNNEPMSVASRRITNILTNAKIKTMSIAESSCSDEENQLNSHDSRHASSSINTDADESDHEINNNKHTSNKVRRLQKTRKTSFSLANNQTPPATRVNNRKDDQQHRSSSNEDDNHEANGINDESNVTNRRIKSIVLKPRDHLTTTTTTDDDTTKKYHRYYPLENLEGSNQNVLSESTGSSSISTAPNQQPVVPGRKVNRFQVKSIRKSQQQHFLLANAAAAKSSNDDDFSGSNQVIKSTWKPSFLEHQNGNTATTDGETSTANTDNNSTSLQSTSVRVQNDSKNGIGHHRVRFQSGSNKKTESAAEEEKPPVQTATLPTPQPPASSALSTQGEDEEEEEAVAKSPYNRFIKYAKEIGRGAFKTVYRGLDTETSVPVAWCELQDFAQFDKHERARFKEEAEMLKKLQHQNIVRFYDFWEETNPRTNKKVIILVTELMTSGSLKSYIRNFKGQKEERRINVMKKWCRQILKGLAYLHSRNPPVIHRDLKCDNVFISSTTGCVKIGDLGLATFKTQTFAKSMRGTMEFMAPEMFDEKYDELVDVYSFGLCMLEMITDDYPYSECKGPTAVIKRITAGLKPDCYYKVESEDVREVIDCCIRTQKEERLCVQDLLQHSFFLDDNGLRIDLVRDSSNDSSIIVKNDSLDLKLKIVDRAKRNALYANRQLPSTTFEALLFPYNLKTDTPEQIADELIAKNYIYEDDKKFVIQSIKDRVRATNYEINDRRAGIFSGNGKTIVSQTIQPPADIQSQQQQQQQQQIQSQQLQQQQQFQSQQIQQQQQQLQQTQAHTAQQQPLQSQHIQQQLQQPQSSQQQQQLQQPQPSQQQQHQQFQSQQQTPVLISVPQPTPLISTVTSIPSTIQQTTVEQQQQQIIKANSEISANKPNTTNDVNPITQLTDLSQNIPGSPGSLEVLDAALKKTFNKNNVPSNTNAATNVINESVESSTTLTNQDENSTQKSGPNNTTLEQQYPSEETVLSVTIEPITNIVQSSTSAILHNQSPINAILTNQSQQIIQNSHILSQQSPSVSFTAVVPTSQHTINNTISNESVKQSVSSISSTPPQPATVPSSSTTTEIIESNSISISPSPTPLPITNSNDLSTFPPASDIQSQTPASLQQLEALLVNTFKKQIKTTGTAHSSDSEAANASIPPLPTLPITNNDDRIEADTKSELPLVIDNTPQQILDISKNSNALSQSQIKFSDTLNESTNFDPLMSTEMTNSQEIDTFLKGTSPNSLNHDENSIDTSQTLPLKNDTSDIKSIIIDFSRLLLNKMNAIEAKIDDHSAQTRKMNHLLTNTILPSLIDITETIQATPQLNLDSSVKSKLENIRTNIQLAQQQQLIETKNLMDI